MKKILLCLTFISLVFLSSSATFAQDSEDGPNPFDEGGSIEQTLTQEKIDALNPLIISESPYAQDLSTPGGILSRVLFFAFPLAGIILFVMLIWAGFVMVSGATEKKSQDAGKQRATAAVIGFVLLFVSYWIIKILEIVTGAKIF